MFWFLQLPYVMHLARFLYHGQCVNESLISYVSNLFHELGLDAEEVSPEDDLQKLVGRTAKAGVRHVVAENLPAFTSARTNKTLIAVAGLHMPLAIRTRKQPSATPTVEPPLVSKTVVMHPLPRVFFEDRFKQTNFHCASKSSTTFTIHIFLNKNATEKEKPVQIM